MRTARAVALLLALSGAMLLLSTACAPEQEAVPLTATPPLPTGTSSPAQPRDQGVAVRPVYVLQGFPHVVASFGYSLAAGDINGDGYDDVIVGAPWPEVTPGKVLAFLGGEEFAEEPDAILSDPGEGPSAGFGYFLAAGDVHGDEQDEVIVGKPLGGGKVFVFSDAAGSPGVPSAVLEDTEHRPGAPLGYPVVVGDVNGDGYDDVIAGAPQADVGEHVDAGAVFVFLGGDPLDVICDLVLQAPEPEAGARFGRSVIAGDVNGDGLDDVIAGAYGSSVSGHDSAGQVFVFLSGGPPGETSVRILRDSAPQEDANLGYAVAAGDTDGDGYDDIMAGAFGSAVNGLSGAGKVLVFRGSGNLDVSADAVLQDPYPEAAAGFGYVIHAADVNADGYDDVIVGAPYSNLEGRDAAGEAFLFPGGPTPAHEAERTLVAPSPQSYAYFGVSVAAGDIDANGAPDIIVGAYGANVDEQAGAGQVLIFPSAPP